MADDLPDGKKVNKANDTDASQNKKKPYWKAIRIGAVFGIIEVISLMLWIKAEDFDQGAAHYIRWTAACGFLAGGAFLAHKFVIGRHQKCKKLAIWIFWAAVCILLPFWKSASTTDESGNPIGLLVPANDPIPDILLQQPFAPIPPNATPEIRASARWHLMSKSNVAVLIFGGNAVAVSKAGVISVVGFHGKSFLDIGTGPDGAFVSGDFFGKDGSIVATLQTNRFTLNRLRYFTKRVDKSTLTVIDEDNVELLRIRFCSSVVFEMAGRIRFPDRTEMWACFEKADSKSGSFS